MLLQKCKRYGVRQVSNDWFSSYLKNTTQFISIDNVSPSITEIQTDILQGSLLGYLLSSLYIIDLHNNIQYAETNHFKDNKSLMLSDTSLKVLFKQINTSLHLRVQS